MEKIAKYITHNSQSWQQTIVNKKKQNLIPKSSTKNSEFPRERASKYKEVIFRNPILICALFETPASRSLFGEKCPVSSDASKLRNCRDTQRMNKTQREKKESVFILNA